MTKSENYNLAKLFTFLAVGLVNTFVGYLLYAIFIKLTFSYWLSLFLSTVVGVFFNYYSFGNFVFKSPILAGAVLRFVFSYICIYLFNLLALFLVITYFKVGEYWAQLLCIPFMVFLSWTLMNLWVFKND